MRRRRFSFLLASLVPAVLPQLALGQAVKRINAIAEMPGAFEPGIQVYAERGIVTGDASNVSQAEDDKRLSQLASWMTVHSYWVVVIGRAKGEEFSANDGKRYRDVEAAKYACGTGLANTASFAAIVDQKSGRKSGSIFLMSLDPKDLSVMTSDLLEGYNLGHRNTWKNNYDQAAIGPLRNGFRVVEAVKGVVEKYDGALASAIKAEADAARREQEAKERSKKEAAGEVANAAAKLGYLEERLGSFQKTYQAASGDLAFPNLERIKADQANAQSALAANDHARAAAAAKAVTAACTSHVAALDAYPKASARIDDMRAKLLDAQKSPFAPEAEVSIKEAEKLILAATDLWNRGQLAYVAALEKADAATVTAASAIVSAESSAKFMRGFKAGVLIGVLIIAVVLVILAFKKSAMAVGRLRKHIAQWDQLIADKKQVFLDYLEPKARAALGGDPERVNFQGKTAALGLLVREDVGRLELLRLAVEVVLDEAKGKLSGGSLLKRFTWRWADEVAGMMKRPIKFDPKSDVVKLAGKGKESKAALWAKLEDLDPIEIKIDDLVNEFNERAKRADENCDRIVEASSGIAKVIDGAAAAVTQMAASANEMDKLIEHPELRISDEVDALVDGVSQPIAKARETAISDPIASLETVNTVIGRIDAGSALISAMTEECRTHFKNIGSARATLAGNDVQANWIPARVAALFRELAAAIEAIGKGGNGSVDTKEIAGALRKLAAEINTALALDERRRGAVSQAIAEADEFVNSKAAEIAGQLGIDAAKTLNESEKGRSPRILLDEAKRFCKTARMSIADGVLAAAEANLTQAGQRVERARACVEASLAALKQYSEAVSGIAEGSTTLSQRIAPAEEALREIRSKYSGSVMILGAGDPQNPRKNDTIDDNIEEVQASIRDREQALSQAEALYKDGALLAAMDKLVEAAECNRFAAFRLEEITYKRKALSDIEAVNSTRSGELAAQINEVRGKLDDNRVSEATLALFRPADTEMAEFERDRSAKKYDPFKLRAKLHSVSTTLKTVLTAIEGDQRLYDETARSLRAASDELKALDAEIHAPKPDEVQHSVQLRSAPKTYEALIVRLDAANATFKKPHSTCVALDKEADAIYEAAGALCGAIRKQTDEARKALEEIAKVSGRVKKAGSWRGSYTDANGSSHSVGVKGGHGSSELERAREALSASNFALALSLAMEAARIAENAMSRAKSEVETGEAEAARIKRDRARRKREDEERRSSYSSSSYGGYGSGSSHSSSSSGSSSFGDSFSGLSSSSSFGDSFSGMSDSSSW